MEKIIGLLAVVVFLMCADVLAMEPCSRIDIDGLGDKIPLSINGVSNGKMEYANWMESGELNKMYLRCHFEAADWKAGSISFTPLKSGRLSVGLGGISAKTDEPVPWFSFSELGISGAMVSKGEFGDLPLWFLKPKAGIINGARANEGKSIYVSHAACAYRMITAVEGVQITIKFRHKFHNYGESIFDCAQDDLMPDYPYRDESVQQRSVRTQWFRDARFGVSVNWGIATAIGRGSSVMRLAKISVAEYAKQAAKIDPVRFDPETWAQAAREAGAGYMMVVAKHVDGFALFPSRATMFTIDKASPMRRDVLKEIIVATRRQGLRVGVGFAAATDWHHPGGGIKDDASWDPVQRGSWASYWSTVGEPQLRDLLTGYQTDGLWIENGMELVPPAQANRICAAIPRDRGLIIGPGLGKSDFSSLGNRIPAQASANPWEIRLSMLPDTTTYCKAPARSTAELLHASVAAWIRGGNVLLGVTPDGEGQIPGDQLLRLRDIGAWWTKNKEAIVGTVPGPFFYLPWGRSTMRGKTVYLHVLDWPVVNAIRLPIAIDPNAVWVLGDKDRPLEHRLLSSGVVIRLPPRPANPEDVVVAMTFDDVVPDISSVCFDMPVSSDPETAQIKAVVDNDPSSSASFKDGVAVITIELPTPKAIATLRLGYAHNQIGLLTLEIERDGIWMTVFQERYPALDEFIKTFEPVTAQRIRLRCADAKGLFAIRSIEFFQPF